MGRVESGKAKRRTNRFLDSGWNLLRVTTVRVVAQTVCFALFVCFVWLTTFANLDSYPGLRHWVSKVLEIDPLIGLSTALTTHTVYKGLLWSLIILVPTLFIGRFFCGWVCPYGALHHFVGWALGRHPGRAAIDVNRYRPLQRVKYYILAGMLVAAALGTLQIGLLDPICLLYRSMTGAVLPTVGMAATGEHGVYQGAWLIGGMLFGLVAMNVVYPRFFCRVLCPLGALLGVLSRFAWWRIERDTVACNGCNRCRLGCEGACDPHASLRKAECFVCFNCVEECPEGSLSFRLFPPREHEIAGTDTNRRKLVFGGVTGLLFFPLTRLTGRSTVDFSTQAIRPPGAVEELGFLERCLKCDQCIRVCPTNVLQPAWFESGLEGLWTPVMNFRVGHCQLHCTACGQVCPTGAIQQIPIARKLGLGEFAEQGPIRLGTAHVDFSRCLPHSKSIQCVVCEELCPTSPKAIYVEHVTRTRADGSTVDLLLPRVDIDRCIGCGICERECPVVGDRRGIFVTAEGETRSADFPDRDRNRSVRL
ncbi:MAG: 4Fe-4S binding protein [Phycisphaerae bacterium]|nr:4Fe-4S binding protein [Phycisphaerae bacterium]